MKEGRKRVLKRIVAMTLAIVLSCCCMGTTEVKAAYTGMQFIDGNWRYVSQGNIVYDYTGLACNENGWWYFNNGLIDWNYTGMAQNEYGWWYVVNGMLDWGYTGMACNEYGWWYFNNGQLDWGYTGMACNEYGWWYFNNGQLDWNYTGMALNENGWWYFNNGQIDWNYTGMALNEYGWWYFENGFLSPYFRGVGENEYGLWYYENGTINWGFTGMFCDRDRDWVYVRGGQVDPHYTGVATNEHGTWFFKDGVLQAETDASGNPTTTYTGMAQDETGKWIYMKHGKIDETYTGMALNDYGWWYYNNGTVDFGYTGIARNQYGAWFFRNGSIDFGYTGTYRDGVVTYDVNGGSARAKASSDNVLLGVFFNSREDSSDTLYVSFDGYEFYSIGEAFTNIHDTVDGDDLASCSPSLQLQPSDGDWYTYYKDWNVYTQRDPSIFYKDGYFWMTGTARGVGANAKKMIPMLAYSKDLINWSYPCAGESATVNYNDQNNWLEPAVTPPATNASGGYDAVAGDAFVDDDGTVWFVVSTGVYMDTHSNNLAPYLIKITNLSAPAGNKLDTTIDKCQYSDFTVTYSDMMYINLPTSRANAINKTWTHGDYDYDGSLFKRNGKYYYVVQHSGEYVQMWSINNLNNVSDPNAWTLVSPEVLEGSEGPCVVEFNGMNYLYTDRYPGWKFYDIWGDGYGITVASSRTLDNGGNQYTNAARIVTRDKSGIVPARHGSVIKLTDPTAIQKALEAYQRMGY